MKTKDVYRFLTLLGMTGAGNWCQPPALRGGLKSIERELGINREGALSQVDGFMAVLLWRAYQQGHPSALDTLVRYALEDVLNLKPLLEFVYNKSIKSLPLEIDKIESDNLPEVNLPYDAKLIEQLMRY